MIPSVNCPRGMCWEAGRCSVWGYPGLHSKFQTSESCILWPCLRNTENEMVSCTVPWRMEHYIATRNVLREKRQSWQLSGLRWKRLSDGTVGSWEWWERPDRCSLLLQSIAPTPAHRLSLPGRAFPFFTIPVVTWVMGIGSWGLLWFFFWRQDLLARSCMVTWRFGKRSLTEVSQHEGPYWF